MRKRFPVEFEALVEGLTTDIQEYLRESRQLYGTTPLHHAVALIQLAALHAAMCTKDGGNQVITYAERDFADLVETAQDVLQTTDEGS